MSFHDSNVLNVSNANNITMPIKLRVHIAPVGFEFQRITGPLEKMKADRVYLVSHIKDDKAIAFIDAIKDRLKDRCPSLEIKEEHAELWDLFDCVKKYRDIFNKEKANDNMIFVNVSTGSKVAAIAGTIACMLWGGTPYYQKIEYEKGTPDVKEEALRDEILEVPVFSITHPKEECLLIIDIIERNKGRITKKELIKVLKEKGVIKPRSTEGQELSKAAEQSQLRVLLDPMEHDFMYVTVESRGRRSIVRATREGRDALKIFGLKLI